MTKEELEKESEEYLKKKNYTSGHIGYFASGYCKQAYIDSAEPREKQIQIDAEQIRALQKDKGELTDRVKELETSVSNLRKDNKELREVLPKLDKENDELKYKLANAKELLKKWVELFKPKVGNIPPTPIQVKTEQFLSEVEYQGVQKVQNVSKN